MSCKVYIIAGEASGDLHGSNLIYSLYRNHPNLQIKAWGGDLMKNAGAELVVHYKDIAFMGFVEVVAHLGKIIRYMALCKRDVLLFRPDILILIDYPGFNMRIAQWAKKNGIKVAYYITPQIWAWNTSRVHNLVENTDMRFVILPFEQKFFKDFGYSTEYVGHPLLDAIHHRFDTIKKVENPRPFIALLPGSRQQEIHMMLPIMIDATKGLKYDVILAASASQTPQFYQDILSKYKADHVKIVHGDTYAVLKAAHLALVTSGTATLETAIFKVPQIVCYKTGKISYFLAKRLIKTPYISLVNLIMESALVPELIQKDCNPTTIQHHLSNIEQNRNDIIAGYDQLIQRLGSSGASDKVAHAIIKALPSCP